MLTLTETAKTQLDGYFADKEKTPIRIYLATGG
jgi:iron-sulfur cluster assembly protein